MHHPPLKTTQRVQGPYALLCALIAPLATLSELRSQQIDDARCHLRLQPLLRASLLRRSSETGHQVMLQDFTWSPAKSATKWRAAIFLLLLVHKAAWRPHGCYTLIFGIFSIRQSANDFAPLYVCPYAHQNTRCGTRRNSFSIQGI